MLCLVMTLMWMTQTPGVTTFSGSGIFETLSRAEVAVTPNGEVFAINFQDKKIVKFGPDGKVVSQFGGKGSGPGEFEFPSSILFWNNTLIVQDRGQSNVTLFDLEGNHLKTLASPSPDLTLVKVQGGWLQLNAISALDPSANLELKWSDEGFDQWSLIGEWPREVNDGGFRITSGSSPKVPFNPIVRRPILLADNEGRLAFLHSSSTLKIDVFDMVEKKLVRTIKRSETPVPFNEAWGMERYNQAKERMKSGGGFSVDLVPDFPTSFPIVRGLSLSAEGLLIVEKWTGQPEKKRDFIVMDSNGDEASLGYDQSQSDRVVAIYGDVAYLLGYDKDQEEALIYKLPKGDIDTFAAKHPIEAEPNQPRMLFRTR